MNATNKQKSSQLSQPVQGIVQLIARLLLGHIFVIAGINKIVGYAGTQGYMESMGVPGFLLPLVIILEVVAGLAVILGWQTRLAAFLLAGFTILSGVIFHTDFSQPMQLIMLMKNLSIAGGLLLLFVHGAGIFSISHRLKS